MCVAVTEEQQEGNQTEEISLLHKYQECGGIALYRLSQYNSEAPDSNTFDSDRHVDSAISESKQRDACNRSVAPRVDPVWDDR